MPPAPTFRQPKTYLRILGIAVGAGVLGYAASFLIPSQFASYMTLYFPMDQSKGANALTALAGAGVGGDGGTVIGLNGALVTPAVGSAPRTAFGLLKSRECRVRVVRRLLLDQKWGMSLERTLEKLSDSVNVRTDENNFVKLEAVVRDPELAQQIVRAYHKSLAEMSDELQVNVSKSNREFVAALLAKKRKQIAQMEADLVDEYVAAGPVDRDLLIKNYIDTRSKLAGVEISSKASQATLGSVEASLNALYRQAKTSPGAAAALQDLAEVLQTRLIELSTIRKRFMPGSAEYQEAQRNLQAASEVATKMAGQKQKQLSQGIDPAVSQLYGQIAGLSASAQEYLRQIKTLGSEIEKQPAQMVKIEAMQRELGTASKSLALLEGEYQTAVIAESRDPAKFELVDKPFLPDEPVFPRKGLIAGIVFIVVLFGLLLPQVNQLLRAGEGATP